MLTLKSLSGGSFFGLVNMSSAVARQAIRYVSSNIHPATGECFLDILIVPSLLHLHLSLSREGGWSTTDVFTTAFLLFFFSPLSSGTWRTQDLSIP